MALLHQHHFPNSFPSILNLNPNHYSPKSSFSFSQFNSLNQKLTCFSATSSNPTTPSPPSIFLSLLEDEEEEEEEEEPIEEPREEETKIETFDDPLLKFFTSRTSTSTTQTPHRETPLSFQKNRRSSWHLGPNPDFQYVDETEITLKEGDTEKQSSFVKPKPRALPDGVIGDIVQIAKDLPENMTLGEVLGDFVGRIGEKECLEVLHLLGEEGLVMGCLYFFEWMGLQEPSLVTPRAYSFLFPLLGRAGMGDKIMVLFKNVPLKTEFLDVHVYNSAMSGLMCSKRYDDSCKVYETMETNNIQPDHVTCSIMITVMRKTGRSAKDAWDYFEKMNRKGVKWSPEVLGALIKSFCDEGLKSQALIIQLEMEKKGVASNAIVYNTIMDAFSKSNQIEEAEGLLAEMRAKGVKPTSATFNILMDAYSRRMQPEVVEKLLVEMKDMGLEPNVKSYTCLISAYGRQKNMSDMAADAYLRMKKNGIKPTSHSYTALIHAYSVSGWHEKAYLTFENMQREGLKPAIETYTTLLDAFRRAGDTEMLMKIWKLMISAKIEGTRVTFNILLDGFAKQGHYVEARDVISEFGKIGLQPTVMTYNMLMNAYARGGQHSKMPQLLKEMATLELKPDSVTYMTIIYAYLRVRDFKRAFFYHKKMVKSGQLPDVKSYQKLRAVLDAKVDTKNRKDKSAILGIINSKVGMLKAKKKGKKDEFWKNKRKHVKTHRTAN